MDDIKDLLAGNSRLYSTIAIILTLSFIVNALLILLLNIEPITIFLDQRLGEQRAFFMQLFIWGTSGATIAGSAFMAKDKDINEVELTKKHPDPAQLRYPNIIDVWLYVQHILSGGFLALAGTAIILAGLGYFDAPVESMTTKHKLFLVIFCFLVGLYEKKFLASLENLSKRLFNKQAKQ